MSDQFSKTIRAHAGGANPPVSIGSVSEAAAHIAALQGTVSRRLHWQLARRIVEEAGNWPAGTEVAELAMRNALATDGYAVE